jgi:hypothetical protein
MPISTHLPTCTNKTKNSTLQTFQKCHPGTKFQQHSHRTDSQRDANGKGKDEDTYSRETIFQKTQAHNGCHRRDHNWTYESATQQQKQE